MVRSKDANRHRRWLQCASYTCLVTLMSMAAQPTFAQVSDVSELVVTGSRVIRDGSQAPTPVTVIGAEDLQRAAPRNLVEGIISLPAFRGSNSTNTAGLGTASNSTGSFLNLRNLGPQRTLVLLDGRRVAPAANNGSVNFNMLPESLISRVDVVTGGASAAYGSDAVAGVVNVILQTNFEGAEVSAQAGISEHGDVGSRKFSFRAGDSFLNGRLHLVGSLFHNETDEVLSALGARDWASDGNGRLIIGSGASQYSAIFSDVNQNNYAGGVILAGTSNGPPNLVGPTGLFPTGVKFLPGGVSSVYNRGINVTANNAVGGDGSRNTTTLAGGLEQTNVFGRVTYDVSNNIEVYGQVLASRANNVYQPSTNQNQTATAITIFEGNPFIPTDIAGALAASSPTTMAGTACGRAAGTPTVGVRCFKMARIHQEDIGGGIRRITNYADNEALDLVVGFEAQLNENFDLSGYYEHGTNDFYTQTNYNAKWENFFAAADAVRDPATGQTVCRVSITNPGLYPGCVPINLFGAGSPSHEALNYAFVSSWFRTEIWQDVAALELSGEAFDLPAGPVGVAVGAEYRTFEVDQTADPGNTAIKQGTGIRGFPSSLVGLPGAYNFGNVSVFSGKVVVKEVYGEVNVPLLKDLPLIDQLELNVAVRYTDYSTSGGVGTYKFGAIYSPVEALRLRGTYSRDIRAPSPIELFQGNGQGSQTVIDPFKGNQTFNILGSLRGNPALDPEEADTYAVGVVYRPEFLPGFMVSLDYYNIAVNGAIGTLTTQMTVDECFQGNAALCQNIVRDPNGIIISVLQPYLNLQKLKTSGVDAEFQYRTDLHRLPGSISARLLIGYLSESSTQAPGGKPIDSTGQVGSSVSNPRYRGQASLTWENGPLELNANATFIGAGRQNTLLVEAPSGPNTIIDNNVPSVTTYNVGARYKFGHDRQYEGFVTINNLFDTDPPVAPGTNSANFIETNYQLYETIGRYYTVGIRAQF